MTLVVLPNTSVTGANLWSQVEDNDKAIRDVVNGDIDATNLADDAVTTPKIDDAAVTTSKLAGDAVDGTKLADDAVTAAKLRDDASTDANRAVTTNHIRDGAIIEAKLAANAVSSGKVADGAIGTAKIADDAITPSKLNLTVLSDTTNTVSAYAGTGQSAIGNFNVQVTPGVWLITAQLLFNTNNGLEVAAYLRDGLNEITPRALFEGVAADRTNFKVPVSLTTIYTATTNRTISAGFGSGAGGSVDVEVPDNSCALYAVRIA